MKPTAQTLKKAGIASAAVLVIAILGVQTALLWGLRSTEVEVLNPVDEVTVMNPVTDVTVSNPVDEVSVLNPIEEVTVLNPVDEVTVMNPVRSVSVSGQVSVSRINSPVQTAISSDDAELYGFCSLRGNRYNVNIQALAGGVEHTVAEGEYTGEIASLIGEYVSQHYYGYRGIGLDFGDSSEDCSGLEGWE